MQDIGYNTEPGSIGDIETGLLTTLALRELEWRVATMQEKPKTLRESLLKLAAGPLTTATVTIATVNAGVLANLTESPLLRVVLPSAVISGASTAHDYLRSKVGQENTERMIKGNKELAALADLYAESILKLYAELQSSDLQREIDSIQDPTLKEAALARVQSYNTLLSNVLQTISELDTKKNLDFKKIDKAGRALLEEAQTLLPQSIRLKENDIMNRSDMVQKASGAIEVAINLGNLAPNSNPRRLTPIRHVNETTLTTENELPSRRESTQLRTTAL